MSTEAGHPATEHTLAYEVLGAAEHPRSTRVGLVHGFAQNRRCLGPLADALAAHHQVLALDAPGHGGSTAHARSDLVRGAELLSATTGTSVLVGYSMGARLCLHAALGSPEQVEALVLIGGTAGIDDEADRADRRASDELLARRLEDDGLDVFIEHWLRLPMFAGLPDWARFDDERRTNSVDGLASSLRHAGTGSMQPRWDELDRIACPVLCVTGQLDERYGELAERMVASIGTNARHVRIPGAGHAAHLEAPNATFDAVDDFLRTTDLRRR